MGWILLSEVLNTDKHELCNQIEVIVLCCLV